jgi:hypothetical protein
MKSKWNVNPECRTTIARLLGELEGVAYILDCIDENDYNTVQELCSKYYKIYFSMNKK